MHRNCDHAYGICVAVRVTDEEYAAARAMAAQRRAALELLDAGTIPATH